MDRTMRISLLWSVPKVIHQRHALHEALHTLLTDLSKVSVAAEVLMSRGKVIRAEGLEVRVGQNEERAQVAYGESQTGRGLDREPARCLPTLFGSSLPDDDVRLEPLERDSDLHIA